MNRRRLRIATWNINSLRLRAPLLEGGVEARRDLFAGNEGPGRIVPGRSAEGARIPLCRIPGHEGLQWLAVLSRRPIEVLPAHPDWCGKGDCRHLPVLVDVPGAPIVLHNFYVPAGGDIPDREQNPKYAHKLDFVAEARAWFAARPGTARTVLVGDLNIAPLEKDVWSHRQLLSVVSHTPPETEGLTAWLETGFVDAIRHFVPPEEKLFTWWSYRNQDWRASDRGRRLDHIWITPDLTGALLRQKVLKDARDWPQGSDHVPVCVELGL